MLRLLVLASLLLAPWLARAQGVCAGLAPTGPATMTEAAPEWAALPCVPNWVGDGTGKGFGLRASLLSPGVVGWLWCPSGTGWALRWGAITWADAIQVIPDLPVALGAADKRKALADLGHVHLSRDIADPELKAIWCPHWAAMLASRPAADVWVVANAISTASPPGTRPAFPWFGGVRGLVSSGRASQGEPCDQRVGVAPWHGVNGRTDQVASCVKR